VLKAAFLCALACLIGVVGPAGLNAAQERYDYDALGRLIRVIDELGRVTEYVYDAAGNILQVITGGTAQAPAITAISPTSIRRGGTAQVTITGSGFTGAAVGVGDPGLDVSGVQSTATQISFSLAATLTATLGLQQIVIRNAVGTASASITVNPALPKLGMSPQPVAIPPDNIARNFFVTLSNADNVDYVVTLASVNPAVATVSPASVTVPAGQTQVLVSVTGKSTGNTTFNLSSAGLASVSVPVFSTAEFLGYRTNLALPLGVVLQSPNTVTSTVRGPFASKLVGVAKGAYISGIAPKTLTLGTTTNLVISGSELGGVTGVGITVNFFGGTPGTTGTPDIAVGAFSIAPDGRSITVPVTVFSFAQTTVRRVVLQGPQFPYLPAPPNADQILITVPPPEIVSIDPIFGAVGTTAMTLTIRGRNFQGIQAVTLTPGTGISVDANPSANQDVIVLGPDSIPVIVKPAGVEATVRLSIAASAPADGHVVRVVAPGGTSDSTATSANTFTVVREVGAAITPIASPLLGVVLQDATPPPPATQNTFASLVGVTVGSVVTGLAPAVGIIGETTTLTLTGNELQGVTSVQFAPPDGVTLGAPSVSPDGKSMTVNATIAANAPQTIRALRVLAGAASVPFSSAISAQFRVSAPAPVFDSITPNFLLTGAPAVSLTIRGRNLQNASAVAVTPPAGINITNPPSVDPTGTQLAVTLSAAANAATGPRAVTVTTPGGTSSNALTAANAISITTAVNLTVTPVASPVLGVVLQDNTPPPPQIFGPVSAPAVGVVLQDPNPPAALTTFTTAPNVGVAVGPIATGVAATPLSPNTSGTLTVSGFALSDVTSVTVIPSTGITLGALTAAPDGSQVSVPITVQAGAATGLRGVNVLRGAARVEFAPAGTNTFRIGVGAPNIDSITPILASRGQTFTMIIRGQNFQDFTAVTATPGSGMFIDTIPTASADGTSVTVRIGIAPNAPLEAKVIQVVTPSGATRSDAVPANTFTVQP
jgi:YD repeat-containing protein